MFVIIGYIVCFGCIFGVYVFHGGNIKVILTTGSAATGESGEREQSSEFEILTKPYRLSELARKVRRVLDMQGASA